MASFTFLVFLISSLIFLTNGELVRVRLSVSSCSLPKEFDVTINVQNDVITISLTANSIVTYPSHVVLMNADDATNIIRYDQLQAPGITKAYHNVNNRAAFVVKCSHKTKPSDEPKLRIDGTLFLGDSKFRLYPTSDDDAKLNESDLDGVRYFLETVEEHTNPHDHDYIELSDGLDQSSEPSEKDSATQSLSSRQKRQAVQYYIDVLPIIDYKLYTLWLSKSNNDATAALSAISAYMTNVFTAMSIRLGTLSLNNKVLNLRMMEPRVMTNPDQSRFVEDHKESISGNMFQVNVTKVLHSFRDWLDTNASLPENDHAMLFTGYAVFGGTEGDIGLNITKGLAFLNSTCNTHGYSSSVVTDHLAYQSESVAVHELGHSLGSTHDGDKNNACSSHERYIMASGTFPETPENKLHPFQFSSCSSQEIDAFITSLESTDALTGCLDKQTGKTLNKVVPLRADDQCRAFLGNSSYVCRGNNIPPFSQVCTDLYCAIPGTSICQRVSAATGTCCQNGKFCKEGQCVEAGIGECPMNETCPLDDQPGVIALGLTCPQFHDSFCYQDPLRQRCCHHCDLRRTNATGCEFGDKQQGCKEKDCGATLTSGLKYNSICCKTCPPTQPCMDKSAFLFQGIVQNCSQFISTQGKFMCYFQTILQSTCCQTCNTLYSGDADCPFGDQRHEFNCHKIPPLNRSCTEREKSFCCETCPGLEHLSSSETTPATVPGPTTASTTASTPRGNNPNNPSCTGNTCGAGNSVMVSLSAFLIAGLLHSVTGVLYGSASN